MQTQNHGAVLAPLFHAGAPPALQLLVLSVMTARPGVHALPENLEERL
jgi:hypothetical protein